MGEIRRMTTYADVLYFSGKKAQMYTLQTHGNVWIELPSGTIVNISNSLRIGRT